MTIEDLKVGDLVRYRQDRWPRGHYVVGTVRVNNKVVVGSTFGGYNIEEGEVELIEPAKYYVNSDKTEPDMGDVARPNLSGSIGFYFYDVGYDLWFSIPSLDSYYRSEMPGNPKKLLLLVDGKTGKVPE